MASKRKPWVEGQPTVVERDARRRERVERSVGAVVIFGLGWFAGGLGDDEPAPQPEGWSVGQLTKICPLLTEYALDPATVSGCEGATDEIIDEMGRQHQREQGLSN